MYKLFLSLRYLRYRYLAIIASLAVALCVAMMLIVASVMDGFLAKIETAAKGLGGDIIVEANSIAGLGRYDEFIARLTGRYRVDSEYALTRRQSTPSGEVEVVFEGPGQPSHAEELAGGLTFDKPVTVAAQGLVYRGGRMAEQVTGALTLTAVAEAATRAARPADSEAGQPSPKMAYRLRFTANLSSPAAGGGTAEEPLALHTVYAKRGDGMAEIKAASPLVQSAGLLRIKPAFTQTVSITGIRLPERLAVTDFADGLLVQKGWRDATFNPPLAAMVERSERQKADYERIYARESAGAKGRTDDELLRRLNLAIQNLDAQMLELEHPSPTHPPSPHHMILGLGIGGLSFRTSEGETVRHVTPGRQTVLTLLPIGRGRAAANITPNIRTFEVVDDIRTDIYSVDSQTVYVPFETLQSLSNMGEQRDLDDPSLVDPARCTQINIKAAAGFDKGQRLIETRRKVEQAWNSFVAVHPEALEPGASIYVQTWREKWEKYISPFEKQRTLMTILFGIISFVSVLLIFAIFYMIVVQKTRDIGIIRAVGGSSAGVAQVFLAFGAATGVVGSAVGLAGGWLFAIYINEIQDWLAAWFGFRVWDREVFMFDKIPSQVDPAVAVVIALWAIFSGLVGALIPGVRAAAMEPVEAIRNE